MTRRTGRTEEARRALLDQVAYLLAELDALEPLLAQVDDAVLSGRPWEGERTVKEYYGLIVALDERVRLPALRAVRTGEPLPPAPDEEALLAAGPWNELDVPALLTRLRAARTELVARLETLAPEEWERSVSVGGSERDVYALAYAITQEDVDLLRAVGDRLHTSRFTSRRRSELP